MNKQLKDRIGKTIILFSSGLLTIWFALVFQNLMISQGVSAEEAFTLSLLVSTIGGGLFFTTVIEWCERNDNY